MPHQCLKCGKTYPDGSPMVLKGCNECGGTRFFYTEHELDEKERKVLIKTANQDLKSLVRDVLTSELKADVPRSIKELDAQWLKVSPKTAGHPLKKLKMEPVKKEQPKDRGLKKLEMPLVEGIKHIERPIVDELKKLGTIVREPRAQPKEPDADKADKGTEAEGPEAAERPEVVDVKNAGVYEIDVEALLEENPIIVKRDGTYLVHLPSLFERLNIHEKKTKAS